MGTGLIHNSTHKSCESEALFLSAMIPPLSPALWVYGMLFNSDSRAGTTCLYCRFFIEAYYLLCILYVLYIYQIHSVARGMDLITMNG